MFKSNIEYINNTYNKLEKNVRTTRQSKPNRNASAIIHNSKCVSRFGLGKFRSDVVSTAIQFLGLSNIP